MPRADNNRSRKQNIVPSYREKVFKLTVKLRGESLVMAQNQRGFLDLLNDIGHSEGLARACDTEQCLCRGAIANALNKLLNGLRLIACRFILG